MNTKSSKFWGFALPVSILILAAAYYIKVPAVRHAIDARTDVGKRFLGRFVQEPEVIELPTKKAPVITSNPAGAPFASKPAIIEKPATPEPFDLQKLARNPALWPKKVALKKAANFPAVVNDKVIGNVTVPVGVEVNLKAIKDGKVGLEYQGGGAWLAVDDTDLATRAVGR